MTREETVRLSRLTMRRPSCETLLVGATRGIAGVSCAGDTPFSAPSLREGEDSLISLQSPKRDTDYVQDESE